MSKLIKTYLNVWYIPVLVIVILGFLGLFTMQYPSQMLFYLSLLMPLLAIISSLGLGLLRLFKKDFKKGLLQIGLTTIAGAIGFILTSFLLMFYPYDFYASGLKIPDNVLIHKPKGEKFKELVIHSSKLESTKTIKNISETDFELRNSFQPGLYEIDVWVGKLDSGKVFLRVFELTNEDPLSEPMLQVSSTIELVNTSDTFKKFSSSKHFTIYEGDWGDPYAARFELWYKSKRADKEVLLAKKNYQIEGWMR